MNAFLIHSNPLAASAGVGAFIATTKTTTIKG